MSEIEFEGERRTNYLSTRILGAPMEPKIIKSLLKMGIVKTPRQAAVLLIAFAIFCLGGAITISFFYFKKNSVADDPRFKLSPAVIEKLSPELQSKINVKK